MSSSDRSALSEEISWIVSERTSSSGSAAMPWYMGSDDTVIGVAAVLAETAEVEDTVIASDWEDPDVPAALDEEATVSGEVEEESSVEDAIVDVDKYELGHHVVRLITSGLVYLCRSCRRVSALVAVESEVKRPKTF
jgi:hypothetical protein